jgi:hypothetical protein
MASLVTMPPGLRRFALLVHIGASVGWFGAVVAFLALAAIGVLSTDEELARSAYLVMEPVGWFVVVPLNVASLLSGLVSSLGSAWGLFRHYWVIAKLVLNVVATILLLLYMQTLGNLAVLVRQGAFETEHGLRDPSPLLHTGGAIALLIAAMVLAVYKPRGTTAFAHR